MTMEQVSFPQMIGRLGNVNFHYKLMRRILDAAGQMRDCPFCVSVMFTFRRRFASAATALAFNASGSFELTHPENRVLAQDFVPKLFR